MLYLNESRLLVILALLIVIPLSAFASSLEHGDVDFPCGSVTQVANGVCAGKGTATSRETVYFGMELVDQSNIDQWRRYRDHANYMVRDSRGVMVVSATLSEPERRHAYDESIKEVTGFSEAEYTAYMKDLYEKGLYKKEKLNAINGVRTGIVAFNLTEDGKTYVVYASKKPVTGKFPFPITNSFITLKDFDIIYDDILMSVGSEDIPKTLVYHNRGIFRNPKSFIDGGYKGLSLKLHGFSAAVAILSGKQYMVVNAAPAMQEVLNKHLKPKDAFIDKQIPAEYQECIPSGAFEKGILDVPYLIKIDALARFYTENN